MSASLNKVLMMGRLTADPEIHETAAGPLTKFIVAINESHTDKDSKRIDNATFVPVAVFGKQGEACGKFLTKAREVFVEGRMDIGSYEKDGVHHRSFSVKADRVQFLGKPPQSDAAEPAPRSTRGNRSRNR